MLSGEKFTNIFEFEPLGHTPGQHFRACHCIRLGRGIGCMYALLLGRTA
jgi:hypothetical protein